MTYRKILTQAERLGVDLSDYIQAREAYKRCWKPVLSRVHRRYHALWAYKYELAQVALRVSEQCTPYKLLTFAHDMLEACETRDNGTYDGALACYLRALRMPATDKQYKPVTTTTSTL